MQDTAKKQLTFEQQKAVIKIIAESGLFNTINFAGASTRKVDALFFSNLRFLEAY
ncbi:MAG: hypothetical protein MJ196_09275 [Treponemataceae bacterium]|nr:hypothetical protein [Treponemataceae bacterium]